MADLTPAEQAAADAVAESPEFIAALSTILARHAVAAARAIIADEIVLELGREVLHIGLPAFLDRLVGPENAKRLLAAALEQEADHG